MRVNLEKLAQGLPVPPATRYALALVLFALALALRFGAEGVLPPGYPYLTFFPAIILAAFVLGTAQGTLVAVLALFSAWYFFIPPLGLTLDFPTLVALVFFIVIITVDLVIIHVMKRALEARRREQVRSARLAATRDVMFQELQHRISNNLQLVSALMTLQAATIKDEVARDTLSEASSRLVLLAKIHRRLYDPDGGAIEPRAFLAEMCEDVLRAAGASHVAVEVDADDIELTADRAIPITLIMMELVSNAIEHGFHDGRRGAIAVEMRRRDGVVELSVRDDGAGLVEGFDLASTRSLGLRVVKALAEQLQGAFVMEPIALGNGTLCRLTFPTLAGDPR